MGCSDTATRNISTRATSQARGLSSVLNLDLKVGFGVETYANTGDWIEIPLTDEDQEDLAPLIQDLQVTVLVANEVNLDYKIVLQRRTLGGAWEDVPTPEVVLTYTSGTDTALMVSAPWSQRTLGRKFRLVLRAQQQTADSYARAEFTISAALRLFT